MHFVKKNPFTKKLEFKKCILYNFFLSQKSWEFTKCILWKFFPSQKFLWIPPRIAVRVRRRTPGAENRGSSRPAQNIRRKSSRSFGFRRRTAGAENHHCESGQHKSQLWAPIRSPLYTRMHAGARRRRWRRRRRRRRRIWTNSKVKSNNTHLTGGEKSSPHVGEKNSQWSSLCLLAWLLSSFIQPAGLPFGMNMVWKECFFWLTTQQIESSPKQQDLNKWQVPSQFAQLVGHPTRFMVKQWNPLCLCYYQERLG